MVDLNSLLVGITDVNKGIRYSSLEIKMQKIEYQIPYSGRLQKTLGEVAYSILNFP
jgi:hypothetical protein